MCTPKDVQLEQREWGAPVAKSLKIYGSISEVKLYESDVTPTDVKDFISGLDTDEELNVFINSYGGHVSAGLAIYHTIKAHKGNTTVKIDGFACSIASVIAFSGDTLIVPDSSVMMIHLPYVGIVGNKLDLQEEIKALETIENSLLNVYTNNLRKKEDKPKIKDFMYQEKWFGAEELEEYFNITREESAQVAAKTNVLSKFAKTKISADSAEEYKQRVLRKIAAEKKRLNPGEKTAVARTEKSIMKRFKKKQPSNESLLTRFKREG